MTALAAPQVQPRRQPEQGSAIALAILTLFIISLLVVYVGTTTLGSLHNLNTKRDHTVGMAAADSAVEKYRIALLSHAADPWSGYLISSANAAKLLNTKTDASATVLPSAPAEASFGLSPAATTVTRAGAAYQWIARQQFDKTYSYWQVFHVVKPQYNAARPQDVTIYFRAWATSLTGAITTKPRLVRAEFRPGLFSDYQAVTDLPFFTQDPAIVFSGPVHSNGSVESPALLVPAGFTGISLNRSPQCAAGAEFSVPTGARIAVTGNCASGAFRKRLHARKINLLGAEESFGYMTSRCGPRASAMVCTAGAATSATGVRGMAAIATNASLYTIQLGVNGVRVNGQFFPLAPSSGSGDDDALTVLVDQPVRLSGALIDTNGSRAGRVTIATRRLNNLSGAPDIHLDATAGGTVGAANPAKDSVGVIAQGDVVLTPGPRCLSTINAALLAESGSVSIPGEWKTLSPPPTDRTGLECAGPLTIRGSMSMHGLLLADYGWTVAGRQLPGLIGYPNLKFYYNRRLQTNPPPFFPATSPWQVSATENADNACVTTRQGDPNCH
ncbi:MAG: hypothetical protein H7123_04510 [Thermoleophilia bacterium]|nr:hypothetical protein [Thermoleophilia bacterium]